MTDKEKADRRRKERPIVYGGRETTNGIRWTPYPPTMFMDWEKGIGHMTGAGKFAHTSYIDIKLTGL
jgi:hypothetical protein